MSGTILLVEDDHDARQVLGESLKRRGYDVHTAANRAEAVEALPRLDLDVLVTDVQLGDGSGIDLCRAAAEARPDVPVVVMTAYGNLEVAIAAMRAGAYDFITKPVSTDALSLALARAIKHRELTSEVRRLRAQVTGGKRPLSMVGESESLRRVGELVDQVADSDATVLITGESGTGKELVARALHERSERSKQPFVAINCAAMPSSLLESELFGHVRGAFTDAKKDRPGLFVQAARGTLFLDEIGEMPLDMQVKLLRVLQERRVRPVGGDEEVPLSCRLITATNRDLQTEVDEGRFRADLFYRINVVHIEVPPLRSRQADILSLAQHFLTRHAERNGKPVVGISPAAAQKLVDYPWPGNVRELENCMERAVALTRLSEIAVDDLPPGVRNHLSTNHVIAGDNPDEMPTLQEMEQRYVRRVLAACNGNKSHAAKVLGIDRRSLYRRLEEGAAQQAAAAHGHGSGGHGGAGGPAGGGKSASSAAGSTPGTPLPTPPPPTPPAAE